MAVDQTFSFQQLHITRRLPTHFLGDRRVSQLGDLKKSAEGLWPASHCQTDEDTVTCLKGSLCSCSAFLSYFTMFVVGV
ncbi:hypothetical protein QQF64_033472 [Cirrhinus molitorella]|uniref:Uncharacterized protein n=1 Tax=Cirrhinus molitorella TaxID=172907 RepID=A0ABR3MU09_9TELE